MKAAQKGLGLALLVFALLLWSKVAGAAVAGTVQGTLQFYNHQGNYCPNSQICTGAKYVANQHDTYRPVQSVMVYIYKQGTATIMGQGSTDANGFFGIYWYDPTGFGPTPITLIWTGYQASSRFMLRTTAGGEWQMWSTATLTPSTTTDLGTLGWGSSGSPHGLANLYDGARMMWDNALVQSYKMQNVFSYVQIRVYDTDFQNCPNGCTLGNDRIVRLPADTEYMPESRVMHEMGHVASALASESQNRANPLSQLAYNYRGFLRWAQDTPEWGWVQFEEGMATFLASVALYYQNAPAPYYCVSATFCDPTTFNNLETSLGMNCGSTGTRNIRRYPIQAMRYFWDIYDSVVDSGYIDTLSLGSWAQLDNIGTIPAGTGERQKDELLNSARTADDDYNGRSCVDFREYFKLFGYNTVDQFAYNCGPAGDW